MIGKRVLVIDDELHITQILSFKLKQIGVDVVTANDGEEGYQHASQYHPDLILTDYQMPVMDGYELAVQLNRDPETSNIPILMLTARGHRLMPAELASTNIQGLIPKPFSAREVMARVKEMIGWSNEDQIPSAAVA